MVWIRGAWFGVRVRVAWSRGNEPGVGVGVGAVQLSALMNNSRFAPGSPPGFHPGRRGSVALCGPRYPYQKAKSLWIRSAVFWGRANLAFLFSYFYYLNLLYFPAHGGHDPRAPPPPWLCPWISLHVGQSFVLTGMKALSLYVCELCRPEMTPFRSEMFSRISVLLVDALEKAD